MAVDATGLSDWYLLRGDEGEQVLTVEFETPTTGAVTIHLEGIVPRSPSETTAAIAVPQATDADRLQTSLAVWLDETYSATVEDQRDWKSTAPDTLSAAQRALLPRPADFAFRSVVLQPRPIQLGLTQNVAALSADGMTIVTATEDSVYYTLALQWRIARAATDTFVLTAPSWLAGRLEFQDSALRRVSETTLEGGRTRWVLRLHDPVKQGHFMTATAALPRPTNDELRAPRMSFERATAAGLADEAESFEPLATQRQYVVLVNQSQSQFTNSRPDAFESVGAADLPIKIRQDLINQAAELVRLRRGMPAPLWRIERFEQQQGAPASVNLADLITVVERDGSWRSQVTYRIKNRRRQFLALRMPKNSKLLSVFVQGRASRPVRTERNEEPIILIPLPKTSAADLAFEVKLYHAGRLETGDLPKGFQPSRQEIRLPAPKVITLKDDAEFGIPVAKTRWTAYLPEEFDVDLVDDSSRTNLTRLTSDRFEQMSWMTEAADMLSVLEGSYSYRQQNRARDNLRNLGLAFQRRMSEAGPGREAVDKNVRELQSRIQKQLARGRDVDSSTPADTVGVPTFGSPAVQTKLAGELQSDNRVDPETEADATEKEFRFERDEKPAAKDAKTSPEQERIKAQLAKRRGGESSRLQFGVDFDDLNDELQQQKMRQQVDGKSTEETKRTLDAPAVGEAPAVPDTTAGTQTLSLFAEPALPEAWTAAGGLSIPMDLPAAGQKQTFSKAGGGPRLTLALRPHRTVELAFGLIWSIVWLAIGFAAVLALSRISPAGGGLPNLLVVVGLLVFFMLPAPISAVGFVVFLIGALLIGYRYRVEPV